MSAFPHPPHGLPRWRRWSAPALGPAICLSLSLLGCSHLPPTPPSVAASPAPRNEFSGRLDLLADMPRPPAIQDAPLPSTRPDQTSAPQRQHLLTQFELHGNAAQGQLLLSTPMGTALAQASWDAQGVQVEMDHRIQHFVDLTAMTQTLLGQDLPLAAMFDWLQGRPAAQPPSSPLNPLAPLSLGFHQGGWDVDLQNYAQGRLELLRLSPAYARVRIRLDPP